MAIELQHLIGNLRHTQEALRATAQYMRDAGRGHYANKIADELAGAANAIDSWIQGDITKCRDRPVLDPAAAPPVSGEGDKP